MTLAAWFSTLSWAWPASQAADRVRLLRRSAGVSSAIVALLFVALRGHRPDRDGHVDLHVTMDAFDMPYPDRLFLAKDICSR